MDMKHLKLYPLFHPLIISLKMPILTMTSSASGLRIFLGFILTIAETTIIAQLKTFDENIGSPGFIFRDENMIKINKIWIGPMPVDSAYIKPFRLHYIQNGKEKSWDIVKVHDSVSTIIFNTTRNNLVFVKQFRPPVYHNIVRSSGVDFDRNIDLDKFPIKIGITIEMCAGIVDKNKPLRQIAREEILEECGSDVGTQASKQIMYYCEVTDSQKTALGVGTEDEIRWLGRNTYSSVIFANDS
uniref:Nudix hydrolase domain-containing protein n=1 Tax=Glossina austeni TaxID=7395 RepID=A0A1A9UZ27_GLOAU